MKSRLLNPIAGCCKPTTPEGHRFSRRRFIATTAAAASVFSVVLQKPLTHDVCEARMLARAATEHRVTTQMGNQGHSAEGVRSLCEWIWDGAIGEIREVHAWCDLTDYPWGHAYWSSQYSERPSDTPAVRKNLNWDLWIGPAKERPYHPAYHPGAWRCWWDFGCGMMGDRGAHTLDAAFWALKLGHPSRIEGTSCGANADVHPISAMVTYHFPARGEMPPMKLTWWEGLRAPWPEGLDNDLEMPREGGIVFHGSNGKLMANHIGGRPLLLPADLHRGYRRLAKTLPRVEGENHELDWVRACKAGKPAGSHFEYAGLLTEICLLGNIAKRTGTPLQWDGSAMKFTNAPDANQFVHPAYRKGWNL